MKTNFVKAVIVLTICGTSAIANNTQLPDGNASQTTAGNATQNEVTPTDPLQIIYNENINWDDNSARGIEIAKVTLPNADETCTNNEEITVTIKFTDDENADLNFYDQDANLKNTIHVNVDPEISTKFRPVGIYKNPLPFSNQLTRASGNDRRTICLLRFKAIIAQRQALANKICQNIPLAVRCPDLDIFITLNIYSNCRNKQAKPAHLQLED